MIFEIQIQHQINHYMPIDIYNVAALSYADAEKEAYEKAKTLQLKHPVLKSLKRIWP